MHDSPCRPWTLLACACLGLAAGPALASTRNYLTVEGRVIDHLGQPLSETWVICTGSRRASVPVDSLGSYRLEIPGATLEELERTPLKIRIQARKKGYRFALSNGAPELGLEMRVVKDDGPLSRLRVRSNDSSAVAAVGNSVVLDANPRALLAAFFVGSPGAQYDTPPVALGESDEITVAGESQSIPELSAGEPPTTTPPAVPGAAGTTPQVSTVTRMPAAGSPPAAGRDSIARLPVVLARPSGGTAAPGSPLPAGDGPRRWDAAGSDRGGKPRVVRPGLDPGGSDAAHSRPREAASRTEQVAPHAPGTTGPLSIQVRPGARDSANALSAGHGGAPRARPDSATARPRALSRPGVDPGLRRVLPRDLPAERVLPAPPPPSLRVPSAPGIAAPVTRLAPSRVAAPMCDCTIRGTVEVQWDRPLTSRTEVVIAVEDAPDVSATAELFMGSPRAFEIHPAPCGVHRLLLWTRSRQRFVLVSQEPRVVCTPGGVQQMRLVLEPVARWGAAQ